MLVVNSRTEAHANWSSRRRENENFMKIKRPKKCPKESSVCGENAFASGNRPSCTEIQRIVEKMKKSFLDRKRISISGLPKNFTQKDVQGLFSSHRLTAIKMETESATVVLGQHDSADDFIQKWNGYCYDSHVLSMQLTPLDSLLFVGNVPTEFTESELTAMFTPFGEVCRTFVVYSPITGRSKGYGMVEYASQDQALRAKQKLAMKSVGGRTLRVDCIDSVLEVPADLQSTTLFVDQLPKGFKNNEKLKEVFSKCGSVSFCQIALSSNSGAPRGFGFVDMATWQEAEKAQEECNGMLLGNSKIRVSFGMPGRPGSIILQAKPNKQQTNVPISMSNFSQLQPPQLVPPLNVPALLNSYLPTTSTPFALPLLTIPSLPFTATQPSTMNVKSSSMQSSGSNSSGSMESVSSSSSSEPIHCANYKPLSRQNGMKPNGVSSSSQFETTAGVGVRSSARLRSVRTSASSSMKTRSMGSSVDSDSSDENHTLAVCNRTKVSLGSEEGLASYKEADTLAQLSRPLQLHNHPIESTYCSHCGMTAKSRKRSSLNESLENVYDKPFVRQHQQGIPFVHPAKRLKG